MSTLNRLTARVLLLVAALLLPASVTLALEGQVVAVADGDTLTILDGSKQQHRVRLSEIDAPEKGQPFGTRAKQALSDLCFGRVAEVRDTSADRYGRVVGAVYCDGRSANAELVRQGWRGTRDIVAATHAPASSTTGEVRGNRRSGVYHLPHCPSYEAVSQANRESFGAESDAVAAGYRRAGNCR